MNYLTILTKALDLFLVGSLTYERLVDVHMRVKAMREEGRDPTDDEFADEFADIDEAHARIAAANARRNPSEGNSDGD